MNLVSILGCAPGTSNKVYTTQNLTLQAKWQMGYGKVFTPRFLGALISDGGEKLGKKNTGEKIKE